MKVAGIDIGSTYIKFALRDSSNNWILRKTPTTAEPLKHCLNLLEEFKPDKIVATGYGRHLLEVHGDIETITEIKAFAIGAKAIHKGCKTVIDIGGQDTKVISIDEAGKIKKFEMNDRCAAGTGRFLEIMAKILGYSLEEFGEISVQNSNPVQLSGICTVFIESEVISLISKGFPKDKIATAVFNVLLNRVISMTKRVGAEEEIIFAGGCSKNNSLKSLIENRLGKKVIVPKNSDFVGAIGTVYYGMNGEGC